VIGLITGCVGGGDLDHDEPGAGRQNRGRGSYCPREADWRSDPPQRDQAPDRAVPAAGGPADPPASAPGPVRPGHGIVCVGPGC
jgi:hypothetical protein